MEETKNTAQSKVETCVFNPESSGNPRPTAKGERRIPKGDKFMHEYDTKKMNDHVYSMKDCKERNIGTACCKRREGKTIQRIATEMLKPPSTIRSWLVRGQQRGLYDLADRKSPGRPPIIGDDMLKTIREWLSKSPGEFGFTRKRWQRDMLQKKLYDTGITISDYVARSVLHRAKHSFRKSRPAPHNSASKEKQAEFKKTHSEILGNLAFLGYVILALDEVSCMIGAWNGYGWLPVGGHETIPTSWSKKSLRLMGVLGDGWFHIVIVDATNSKTLEEFLDTVVEKVGKAAIIMDNASYHRSAKIMQYLKDSNGAIEPIFLPPYTPQLNPIETLWRDLKRALAGSYFNTIDELKETIMKIVRNNELQPPKLMNYMLPEGIKDTPKPMTCTIVDMTSPTNPVTTVA